MSAKWINIYVKFRIHAAIKFAEFSAFNWPVFSCLKRISNVQCIYMWRALRVYSNELQKWSYAHDVDESPYSKAFNLFRLFGLLQRISH